MNPKQLVQEVFSKVKTPLEERRFRKIAALYDIGGYKRIYLVHIRKTGGTSLNNMFLSLSKEDPSSLYGRLVTSPGHRILSNGLVFVGWNARHINKGNYFYGFSHIPLHQLDLPSKTFTITCFRDPLKRVISHYTMLTDLHDGKIDHPCMAVEGRWLGNSFDDFLQRIPKEHLLNQLYMFSERLDIGEAVERVKRLSHYFFTEEFDNGILELNKKTGLDLKPTHIRKSKSRLLISESALAKLREMLQSECVFLDRIKTLRNNR